MKRNTYLTLFFIISIVTGTLTWQVIEVLLRAAGMQFTLSTAPIGFDVYVLSLYIRVNIGSFLGLFIAYLRYRKLNT